MKITIIYRCCETDTKGPFRPKYFCKTNCLNNMLDIFKYADRPKDVKIDIIALHDGPIGPLHEQLDYCDIPIEKINVNDNAKSLELSLNLGAGLPETDIIYFLEDDYLHTDDAVNVLVEGFEVSSKVNSSNIISLYLHTDRFTRSDDIDYGQTYIFLGKHRYWRTAESTTCTWAVTQKSYLEDGIFESAKLFGLNDRDFFRYIRINGTILFNPMHGASTHCHMPFMSPFIDWNNV